jgi:hypothetical protein
MNKDGLQVCDHCYLPKYAGQPCKFCACYEANPDVHYDTRPDEPPAESLNPFPSPADVRAARVEAAKKRGIPPLRRGPAKRPGFWRG